MSRLLFLAFVIGLTLPIYCFAQVPGPVADAEMRDTASLRRRALELERVKQDSNQLRLGESSAERELRFKEIKYDFEGLQKMQDLIIRIYKTGKTIDYLKLSDAANSLKEKAQRLDKSLFIAEALEKAEKPVKALKVNNIRDLIVDLDKAVGVFVNSSIFKNLLVIEPRVSEKARFDLAKIVKLSDTLSKVAGKLQ